MALTRVGSTIQAQAESPTQVEVVGTASVLSTPPAFMIDAFGRLRTGDPGNRLDIEFIYDNQPTLGDEVTGGAGSILHSPNSRDLILETGGATASDSAAYYSHYNVPYTPGNSQIIDNTGTLDNAGLGGGTGYIFFRSKVTGTVVEQVWSQSEWNISSESDLDWSASHILQMDFQSLKVGRIQFNLVRSGVPVRIHEINNDNLRDTGYWQFAGQPVFWKLWNDATYTYADMGYGDDDNAIGIRYRIPVNALATQRAICATVKSEGGNRLEDIPGFERGISTGVTSKTVSTTLIPVLSIRVAATLNSLENRGLYVPNRFTVVTSQPIRYVILYRPTLTGASWNAVDATHSGMEYDVAASVVSGGVVIDDDYASAGKNSVADVNGILSRTIMSLGRTGTSDILTIAAVRTNTTNADVFGSLKWKEIR